MGIINEMNKFHDQLVERDRAMADKFEDLLQEYRDFNASSLLDTTNLEVLYKLKQGQVEVEQSAVVTDYNNSALIHRWDSFILRT
jgi:hypothetical protein